jgi:hypothetical protein
MSDHSLSDLERLARMHREGWLSDDEFDAERRRILGLKSNSVNSLRGRNWSWIIIPCVVGLGAVGWWFWQERPYERPASMSAPLKVQSSSRGVPASSVAALPQTVRVDSFLEFKNPANCEAGPSLDKIFEKMLPVSSSAGPVLRPSPVSIGSLRLLPQVQDVATNDAEAGTVAKRVTVRFPAGTAWHDLLLGRLIVSYYAPPDTDSNYTRAITFLAPQDRVRSVLQAAGFKPPARGGYSELTDETCGGSMELIPVPGGTELRCSWGC